MVVKSTAMGKRLRFFSAMFSTSVSPAFMPPSHQNFHLVPTMKLLGTMFENRCWPTTFHTVTFGDANGLCQKWLV